jgi:hypothetical protein
MIVTLEGRTQQRGPITDHFGRGPVIVDSDGHDRRFALCVCEHMEWPEGGYGCQPCMGEWAADPKNPSNWP